MDDSVWQHDSLKDEWSRPSQDLEDKIDDGSRRSFTPSGLIFVTQAGCGRQRGDRIEFGLVENLHDQGTPSSQKSSPCRADAGRQYGEARAAATWRFAKHLAANGGPAGRGAGQT